MSICVPRNYWGGPGPDFIYEPVTDRCYTKTGETCNDCDENVFPVEMDSCAACLSDNSVPEDEVGEVGANAPPGATAQQLRFKITIPRLKTFLFYGRPFTAYAVVDTGTGTSGSGVNVGGLGSAECVVCHGASPVAGNDSTYGQSYNVGFTFTPNRTSTGAQPAGTGTLWGGEGDLIDNAGKDPATSPPPTDKTARFDEGDEAAFHAGGAHTFYTEIWQTPAGGKWNLGHILNPWNVINQPHLGGGIDTWLWSAFWAPAQTQFAQLGDMGQELFLKDGTSDPGYIDGISRIRTTGPGCVFLKDGHSTYGAFGVENETNASSTFSWQDQTGFAYDRDLGGSSTWDLSRLTGQVMYNSTSGQGGLTGPGGKEEHDIPQQHLVPLEIDLSRPILGTDFQADIPALGWKVTNFANDWAAPTTFTPLNAATGTTLGHVQPDMESMRNQLWGRAMGAHMSIEMADVVPTPSSVNSFVQATTFGVGA